MVQLRSLRSPRRGQPRAGVHLRELQLRAAPLEEDPGGHPARADRGGGDRHARDHRLLGDCGVCALFFGGLCDHPQRAELVGPEHACGARGCGWCAEGEICVPHLRSAAWREVCEEPLLPEFRRRAVLAAAVDLWRGVAVLLLLWCCGLRDVVLLRDGRGDDGGQESGSRYGTSAALRCVDAGLWTCGAARGCEPT